MRTVEKDFFILTAAFAFVTLVMGLIIYGLAEENDNMRRKIDRLEFVLRECDRSETNN